MTTYTTIHEVIRDGMDLRIECLKCRHVERIEPDDVRQYVANSRRDAAHWRARHLDPVYRGNPDVTL